MLGTTRLASRHPQAILHCSASNQPRRLPVCRMFGHSPAFGQVAGQPAGAGGLVGQQCPPIRDLTWVKGDPVPIGEPSRDGRRRALVLEFFATWCPHCRAAAPYLSEVQNRYMNKDVDIIGISSETVDDARRWVAANHPTYNITVDETGNARNGLFLRSGAMGVPHAFVVDPDNTITFSGHPREPEFEARLAEAAQKATDREAPAEGGGQQRAQAGRAAAGAGAGAGMGAGAGDRGGAKGAGAGGAYPDVPGPDEPVTLSYDELLLLPVAVLQTILSDRGLAYDDLGGQRDQLADRIVQTCGR